jgi:hypothetical protein
MTSATKYLWVLLLIFSLIGCRGAQTRYNWSNYDNQMYHHYKNPAERDAFVQALKEIMDNAEQDGKMPPGIYAEYGFALYEQGNNQQAVVYFQKEANKWPESRSFMTKLIANANNREKNLKANVKLPVAQEVDADNTVQKTLPEVSK